jgi:hypothetical protein
MAREGQMRLRNGTCRELEAEADEILRQALAGITSRAAKSDILTPWKYQDRLDHEVFTGTGVADPAVRRGQYNRAWNPMHRHLNSRDGYYPVQRTQNGMDTYTGEESYDPGE